MSSGERIAHWRMRNLGLSAASFGSADEVVRRLGAVQSQDYGPAKWSLGQRVGDLRDAELDQAFADGSILRTHVLRPTWHFVLPADIRWMLELTAPRVRVLSGYQLRQLGLDDGLLEKSQAIIARALEGGRQLTRAELGAALARQGID